MLFQEGRDVGAVLFPMLFVVGLFLLGLVIWLIYLLTQSKKEQDTQPVNQQQTSEPVKTAPYILAIGRTATEWEIFVNGQRANADTILDDTTRKEALDALRVLARYARGRLRVDGEAVRSVPESAPQTTQAQSKFSSEAGSPTVEINLTDASRTQTRLAGPTDYPSSSSGVRDMNLAQEISEIVDELLAKTPSLQDHAVDLINAQTDGINFVVDGAVYKEVEDIPNPDIRELIRKATQEWERR